MYDKSKYIICPWNIAILFWLVALLIVMFPVICLQINKAQMHWMGRNPMIYDR